MKLAVRSMEKGELKKVDLPSQFNEKIRPDLIKRAVLSLRSKTRQVYGSDPMAGMKVAAKISKRRRNYRGSYGHGISRVPRKVLSRRGTRFNWQAAFAPGTVKGRRAHPPKVEKVWEQKLNKKERQKAIRSALSAVVDKETVKKKGHIIPEDYPFIIESKTESISKTKEAKELLVKLGFEKELERVGVRTIRAGLGKMRGRRLRKKAGMLIVVSEKCKLQNALENVPGVDTAVVSELNAELLAPGTIPGRATLFTESALEKISKEKLFS